MKIFKWNIEDLKPKFPNIIEKFTRKNFTDQAFSKQEISVVPSVNIQMPTKLLKLMLQSKRC